MLLFLFRFRGVEGNADGLGEVRKRELVESYEVLGVGRDRVVVLDHPWVFIWLLGVTFSLG